MQSPFGQLHDERVTLVLGTEFHSSHIWFSKLSLFYFPALQRQDKYRTFHCYTNVSFTLYTQEVSPDSRNCFTFW